MDYTKQKGDDMPAKKDASTKKRSSEKAPKVLIYSTPTCPYCHMAKEFLDKNKIAYKDFNVADDAKARDEMVKKSGQMGVPVLEINGKIFVGFDKDAIKKALGI